MNEHHAHRCLERILERALPAGLSGQDTLDDLDEEFRRKAVASPGVQSAGADR